MMPWQYPVIMAMQPEAEGMEEEKEKDPKDIIANANTAMDDEYDSRKGSDSTYYSIAHTLREAVLEQPNIMAFGKLKEYQVRPGVRGWDEEGLWLWARV